MAETVDRIEILEMPDTMDAMEAMEREEAADTGPEAAGIDYFFDPKSIAIIGASGDPRKPGGRPLSALKNKGYAGKIFPINPRYQELQDLPCHPSILDVPEPVDLAIVSVPAAAVPEALEQCVAKGVKAAVIFSAGFAEIGEEGRVLQQRITDLARRSGMRLLGPNCLGLINVHNSVMASFAHVMEMDLAPISPKTLGFVTQSGAFGAMMFGQATEAGVGFSSFTSVGNEADTEFSDFAGYLLRDPHTQIIGGYLEGAKDGARLRRVAEQALELRKPILIMKVGRTGAGQRAASSHTGSLAGDDQVYDAFFRQMGIVRLQSLSELVAFAVIHRSGRPIRGRNVAIVSGSGGQGVLLADRCESLGLRVPELTGATREELVRVLPSFGSPRNPVDLTAQAGRDPRTLAKCLEPLVRDESIDVVLMQAFFHEPHGPKLARELAAIYESTTKPVVMLSSTRPDTRVAEECLALVKGAGIPVLSDGLEAAQALAHLAWYEEKASRWSRADARAAAPLPVAPVDELLSEASQRSEYQSKQILERYGIPVTREGLATEAERAVELAQSLGYPVALKVQSPAIGHKTEVGGIVLGVDSDDEVRRAYARVVANARRAAPDAPIQGVLVQEMVTEGIEVIIGAARDPVFGPVVMFGLGGVFVEVLQDVSFRIAPLRRQDAQEMVEEIRGYRVLQGIRGQPPADVDAVIDAILRVSQLVTDHPEEIAEVDVNPLRVFEHGAKAVDALITTRRS